MKPALNLNTGKSSKISMIPEVTLPGNWTMPTTLPLIMKKKLQPDSIITSSIRLRALRPTLMINFKHLLD